MASIRRTDIMHKKYSKGRPAKPERERVNKRQEAYKWRDARRVYLASSFDRWRKLRSSLKLKDSSLAWHLMEAHEKGQCTNCRQADSSHTSEGKVQRKKCDQKEFLPSLIASIRQLCHAHFDFGDCIEIVGLLCLEFDKQRKENFSLNEFIKSGSKPALPSYISKSLHQETDHSELETNFTLALPSACLQNVHDSDNGLDTKVSTTLKLEEPCLTQASSLYFATADDSKTPVNKGCSIQIEPDVKTSCQDMAVVSSSSRSPDMQRMDITADTDSLPSSFSENNKQAISDKSPEEHVSKRDCHENAQSSVLETNSAATDANYPHKFEKCYKLIHKKNSNLCSESEPLLEIDIENMNMEDESSKMGTQKSQLPTPKSDMYDKNLLEEQSIMNNLDPSASSSTSEESQCNKKSGLTSTQLKLASEKIHLPEENEVLDLPLDMSVLKSTSKYEKDAERMSHSTFDNSMDVWSPSCKEIEGSQFRSTQFSPFAGKKKMMELGSFSYQGSRRSPFRLDGKLGGKYKDESHVSIPWQRRDMSRKEEYEFLELSPFCDLAEFSQRYPHVHQRTYYRWKRRIKEEYIILEQCPDMSFQEFSSVVLQAKESVFHHWKSLISQGKGFFAPSDTSKRLEAKCSPKPGTLYSNEYALIQKNLSVTYEQFCQQYPSTPIDVFNLLKRKVMQDFWLFHQNQHMSHKDFSKLVNVSEEVFSVWKDYVECLKSNPLSADIKTISNSMSPHPPVSLSTFQSLGSPNSSGTDIHSQSPKDSFFNMMNTNAALKESLTAVHAGTLNSALNDTMARSLSSSYLASLQNMMFPWPNYYGMTSPLGHQMLPLMLWPGMMGLASGITNPLGLASSSQSAGVSRTSSAAGLHSSLLGATSENSESPKSFESQGKHQNEPQHSNKRSSRDGSQIVSKTHVSVEGDKRLKLSSEKEDDFWGSFSRSRKQNKQEYIYYLKNPELGFKELESLFPAISMRTFYRWRKEMNAAVLLLDDNKDMTFQQFQVVFPDIPEEIFESWKERTKKGSSMTLEKDNRLTLPAELKYSDTILPDQTPPSARSGLKPISSHHIPELNAPQSSGDDLVYPKKCHKEEYLYVHKNPNVDFASFSKLYPNTSVRSFYRWKKELKDAVDYLRANPEIDFDSYKIMDSTVSEEIFKVWKTLAHDEYSLEDDISGNIAVDDRDTKIPTHLNRKLSGPEYWFLQLNPYIDLSQFTRTYPDVPKRTFYRWKQEIQQIMNYIRAQPNIEYTEIASVLPEVSLDAFLKWKEIIESEADSATDIKDQVESSAKQDSKLIGYKQEVDEYTKNLMTKALLHLMHNPTIKYEQFKAQFEFVSAATFDLWLNRIKTVILHIAADPDMDYATFSVHIKDVDEDIYNIWRGLGPDEIAAMDLGKEACGSDSEEPWNHSQSFDHKAQCNVSAFEFCQRNPDITIVSFRKKYPSISKAVFHDWLSKVQEKLEYLKQNPSTDFKEFSKLFPFTKKEIFDQWKSDFDLSKDIKFQNFLEETSNIAQEESMKDVECAVNRDFQNMFNETLNTSANIAIKQEGAEEVIPEMKHVMDYIKQNNHNSHDSENVLNRFKGMIGNLKESSLSKLARFADNSAEVCSGKYQDEKAHTSLSNNTIEIVSDKNKSVEISSPTIENVYKNNNNKSQSSTSDIDNFFNISCAAVPVHLAHSSGNVLQGSESNEMKKHRICSPQLHNSSLTALMAMSRNNDTVGNGSFTCGSSKDQPGRSLSPPISGNLLRQGTNNGPLTFVNSTPIKEDDEGFSSQRQKKMSRAEYMFVKDNPDVDSQEFSRIFPGVSARTFYRWKKEIKAQLQLA